jgi:hypothetical protein
MIQRYEINETNEMKIQNQNRRISPEDTSGYIGYEWVKIKVFRLK